MQRKKIWGIALLACLVASPVLAQSTPICGPLDDGRVADVIYKPDAIFFDPVVEYAWDRAVLTIGGPCEDLVRTFTSKDEIYFDLRDIERVQDGSYQWELRFEPKIDSGVTEALAEARGSGEEDEVWWSLWQKGSIPDGARVDRGSFSVDRGAIIDPTSGEEKGGKSGLAAKGAASLATTAAVISAAGSAGGGENTLATKDVVHNDDIIGLRSLCVGFDCVNGEVFGSDTIRMKENNLRLHFMDTSVGSFPTRDWRIVANSSSNGGGSFLAIEDVDGGRTPFLVEAGAPTDSLRVDDGGRVGLGTATPVVELHVVSGDTPTLRLDQNGSSGFAPQVWDVAGNETSFFIRDATNGSALPFRIRPGASSNRLVIDSDGDIGIGVLSPDSNLNIVQTNATSGLHLERAGNPVTMLFEDSTAGQTWEFKINAGGAFAVNDPSVAGGELILTTGGDLTISGDYFSSTCTSPGSPCAPDYVFAPDYELMPLAELKGFLAENRHLPNVPSEDDLRAAGQINMSKFQLTLLEKIEELTLYTLSLHEENGGLKARLAELEEKLADGAE